MPSKTSTAANRTQYHHGNLRQAVIDATLVLIGEGGFENVNLREVARRAGVSTGAPFRHFPNKTALLTAVAEDAIGLFRIEIAFEMNELEKPMPFAVFRAVGKAYLNWAVRHPAYFRVIEAESKIAFDKSNLLRRNHAQINALMRGVPPQVQYGGRAFVFGLARMYLAGHFTQWGLGEVCAKQAMGELLESFVSGLEAQIQPLRDAR